MSASRPRAGACVGVEYESSDGPPVLCACSRLRLAVGVGVCVCAVARDGDG